MTVARAVEAETLPEHFKLDACLCEGLAVKVRLRPDDRQVGLFDLRVLLALASLAERRGGVRGKFKGIADIKVALRVSELMDEMGIARTRQRPGSASADFPPKSWERVKRSLGRLGQISVTIPYTRQRKGKTERRVFIGGLVRVDRPNGQGTLHVSLACYGGVVSNFYVLVSRRLLLVWGHFTEVEARLTLWLLRRHRGRRVGGRIRHAWEIRLAYGDLAHEGVLPSREGRPGETRMRVQAALTKLAERQLLEVAAEDSHGAKVRLLPGFFHEEER